MLRRPAAIASFALLGALTLGAAGAQAAIIPPQEWDASISGKQTLKWSFAAEQPEECTDYYGTTGEKAQGGGTVSISFRSKTPIGALTTYGGAGPKFSSFNTVGWTVPATYSKQGKFAVISGRPCNWAPGDDELEPLSKILPNNECGGGKVKAGVELDWAAGKFGLGVGLGQLPWAACPGVVIPDTKVVSTAGCLPPGAETALEGESLAPFRVPVDADKFTARKKFSFDATKEYHCSFPSTWPDKGPLTVDIAASYHVTFKPKR